MSSVLMCIFVLLTVSKKSMQPQITFEFVLYWKLSTFIEKEIITHILNIKIWIHTMPVITTIRISHIFLNNVSSLSCFIDFDSFFVFFALTRPMGEKDLFVIGQLLFDSSRSSLPSYDSNCILHSGIRCRKDYS